ncbi:MAG: PA2779 family protein [Deltaproteobacteria bacterium]|jgi:hypothetical protein|nr:PA2779 family protein [Deltaproteobacteria bacterium]
MRNFLSTPLGRGAVYLALALATALALSPAPLYAGFSSTMSSQELGAGDLAKIRAAIENKKVADTLAAFGYGQDEIDARLSQLTPQEISALAGQLDQAMVPSGGAAGIVIGVVVVVLVALGILSLMGKSVAVS